MATIKFYRAKALPSPVTSAHDGVWYIKKPGDSFFRTYVVKGGVLSQEYLDDLEIGGRNYLKNTRTKIQSSDYLIAEYEFGNQNLIAGDVYILKMKLGFGSDRTMIRLLSSNGTLVLSTIYPSDVDTAGWVTKIFTMGYTAGKTPSDSAIYRNLRFYQSPSNGVSLSTIEFLKIEKGTIATDWSPAPEDPCEWLADTVSQSEAEAGTATTRRAWTSQRVRQAIDKRLESFPSGIQSLQEVTDIGNETTKQVVLKHATDQTKTTLSYNGGVFNNYIGPVSNIPGGKDGEASHSASLKAAGLRFDADAPHSVHYNRLGIFYRKDLGFLFPSDRTQASTTMMRSVNGVVPDPVSGNVVIDVNAIKPLFIVTNNECITIWENNTRFIYRTSAVCILATTAHEGKEVVVINDRGLAISVSESSSPFNKLLNLGDLFRQSYTDFPPGFIGRFRVISGEFIQIG